MYILLIFFCKQLIQSAIKEHLDGEANALAADVEEEWEETLDDGTVVKHRSKKISENVQLEA